MHRTILSVIALLVVCPSGPSLSANESVKVGWSAGDGRVLFTELNCSGCHTTNSDLLPLASRQGPRLGDVGGRVTPDYLQRYLLDPHAIKPGTPMPDLLHGMPDQERRQTVEALTHFLVSLGGPIANSQATIDPKTAKAGAELYHTRGCVNCHRPFQSAPKHKIDPAFSWKKL